MYGILGLVKGDLRSEKLLEIDYAKPVADMFRDLSIFMILGRYTLLYSLLYDGFYR